MARLLLSANSVVRLARAVAVCEEEEATVRWEVVFGGAPCAAELAAAFGSLSVGCDLCGEEVQVLQEEEIAREFLAETPPEARKQQTGKEDLP